MTLTSGQLIFNGDYRIEELIGEGAFAEVYKATDLTLKRICAVKVLRSERAGVGPSDMRDYATRFRQEAQLGAKINNSNVIQVYRFYLGADMLALAMEYAPGGSLEDRLKDAGKLSVDETLRMAQEMARGLAAIHDRDVVHRDLKPSNILFDAQGHAKVGDLGLAQVPGGPSGVSLLGEDGVKFKQVGSLDYMSPEQESGKPRVDSNSDIFALGAVVYEMLTGRNAKRRRPGTRVKGVRGDVPEWLDELVLRMLELDAADRPWDGTEVIELLQDGVNGKARAEREAAEKAEEQRKVQAEADRKVRIEREAAEKEEVQRKAQEEIDRKAREEAAQQEARRKAQAEVDRKAREEAARLEAQRKAQEEADRKAREEAARLEAPRKAHAEAMRKELNLTLAPGITLELVRVPTGEFVMGSADSDKDAYGSEKPQHRVNLDEYLIGRYLVTNAQFSAFAQATRHKTTAETKGKGWTYTGSEWKEVAGANWQHPKGPGSDVKDKANHPVVLVSWDDGVAFCKWASQISGKQVRLPTEAEWEKAGRGTDARIYPWGDDNPTGKLCNFNKEVNDTTPVGKYSPQGDSPYGAADMAGNVWERVADWYDEKYYANSPASNPQGPASGSFRVLRGGSWLGNASCVRAAYRNNLTPLDRVGSLGFRVAVSSAPVP